jgi:uncharacterized protein YkwD
MILAAARQPRRLALGDVVRRDPRRFAAMLAIAFGVTSVGLLVAPRTALAWSVNSFSSTSERQLVTLTNQARASAGLRALKVDSALTAIARWRSKDMIVRNYFSHTILGTSYNVFHVLDQKGYCYRIAGENIGWNNYPDDIATAVIQKSFMDSPGHRSNILGKSWDVVGIGAYKGPTGKKMWTVIFADRCGSTSPTPKPTPRPTPRPTPHPTPRPTPRPTPKATPRPKPAATATATPSSTPDATPVLAEPPSALETGGLGVGPGGEGTGAGNGGDTGNGGRSGNGPPPGRVRDATPGTAEASLRVVDPPTAPGLFEAIVAGVTGFFLGN